MAKTIRRDGKAAKRQTQPLSAHALFPVIVALWFAALFGIGSLVIPAALLDSLASATQAGAIVPVGVTARLWIALAATAAGAICGLMLARKVAALQAEPPVRRREIRETAEPGFRLSEPIRRPLSILEAVDGEEDSPLGADAGGSRRRHLAFAEREGPSDWFQANVPYASEHPEVEQPVYSVPPPPPAEARHPELEDALDLDGFVEELDAPEEDRFVPLPEDPAPALPRPEATSTNRTFHAIPSQSIFAEADAEAEEETAMHESQVNSRDPAEPSFDELTNRLAHAIRAHEERARALSASAAAPAEPAMATIAFATDAPMAEDGGVLSYFSAPPPAVAAEFEATSEAAAELRQEPGAQPAAPADSAFAAKANEPHMPRVPAALRQVDLSADDDEESDDFAPVNFGFAARAQRSPADTVVEPAAEADESADEAEDAGAVSEEAFSSLLSMKNPFRGNLEPVRIEVPEEEEGAIEPAVVFPAQQARRSLLASMASEDEAPARPSGFSRKAEPAGGQPKSALPPRPFDRPAVVEGDGNAPADAPSVASKPDPAETERALRSALATLQRISGTG